MRFLSQSLGHRECGQEPDFFCCKPILSCKKRNKKMKDCREEEPDEHDT